MNIGTIINYVLGAIAIIVGVPVAIVLMIIIGAVITSMIITVLEWVLRALDWLDNKFW